MITMDFVPPDSGMTISFSASGLAVISTVVVLVVAVVVETGVCVVVVIVVVIAVVSGVCGGVHKPFAFKSFPVAQAEQKPEPAAH